MDNQATVERLESEVRAMNATQDAHVAQATIDIAKLAAEFGREFRRDLRDGLQAS